MDASRVRFKYKLEGVDTLWQDAGSRRQAFYTNVPPGCHRFQVIAANEDGVWNETGSTVDLQFAAAFYQTRWFYSACGLAVLAVLWQVYQMRVRLLARQMRIRMSERLEERERIARELHDTLLQSTQGLLLIFRAFWIELSEGNPMREKLGSALDRANDVIGEARDRVQELRTTDILDGDLESAFAKAGRTLRRQHLDIQRDGQGHSPASAVHGVSRHLSHRTGSIAKRCRTRLTRTTLRSK